MVSCSSKCNIRILLKLLSILGMAVPLQARSCYFLSLADAKLKEYLLQAHAMPFSQIHIKYKVTILKYNLSVNQIFLSQICSFS